MMEIRTVERSIQKLRLYIEHENFNGYDPYDALNSPIPFSKLGKWPSVLVTQLVKRSPINLRPYLGINKTRSKYAMGILLIAYLRLYVLQKDNVLLPTIESLKRFLMNSVEDGYRYCCWGYDYEYASTSGIKPKGLPTVIHHSYIVQALFLYYDIFKDEAVKAMILKSTGFILEDIPRLETDEGICFGYYPNYNGCCYNASLHATKCLAIYWYLTENRSLRPLIEESIDYVVSKQHNHGVWYYSFTHSPNEERRQIDFHQGFIIESLFEITRLTGIHSEEISRSIENGLKFYRNDQFFDSGRSKWRLPKIYPVDIHNQSQGIITFAKLSEQNPDYLNFAKQIALWTIRNMQDETGYFYYRKYRYFTNKIPYMRWSQAWMFLALIILLETVKHCDG